MVDKIPILHTPVEIRDSKAKTTIQLETSWDPSIDEPEEMSSNWAKNNYIKIHVRGKKNYEQRGKALQKLLTASFLEHTYDTIPRPQSNDEDCLTIAINTHSDEHSKSYLFNAVNKAINDIKEKVDGGMLFQGAVHKLRIQAREDKGDGLTYKDPNPREEEEEAPPPWASPAFNPAASYQDNDKPAPVKHAVVRPFSLKHFTTLKTREEFKAALCTGLEATQLPFILPLADIADDIIARLAANPLNELSSKDLKDEQLKSAVRDALVEGIDVSAGVEVTNDEYNVAAGLVTYALNTAEQTTLAANFRMQIRIKNLSGGRSETEFNATIESTLEANGISADSKFKIKRGIYQRLRPGQESDANASLGELIAGALYDVNDEKIDIPALTDTLKSAIEGKATQKFASPNNERNSDLAKIFGSRRPHRPDSDPGPHL